MLGAWARGREYCGVTEARRVEIAERRVSGTQSCYERRSHGEGLVGGKSEGEHREIGTTSPSDNQLSIGKRALRTGPSRGKKIGGSLRPGRALRKGGGRGEGGTSDSKGKTRRKRRAPAATSRRLPRSEKDDHRY